MFRPADIVISGCGAVTERYYAEALAQLRGEGRARVVGLFDPDPARSTKLTMLFPDSNTVIKFDQLFESNPRLIIVASPPQHHMMQVVSSLRRGVSVLCEKPLAVTLADARAMVAAAASTSGFLAVGMVRRLFPATRAIKGLLSSGVIGELRSIKVFEGGKFRWPVASPAYFQRSHGGGSVLLDIGVHVLDLLIWWLGDIEPVACEDDAMGGIEANVRLEFRSKTALGKVRLSRDWYRPNQYTIHGSNGSIQWNPDQESELSLSLDGLGNYVVKRAEQTETSFIGCFTQQIRNVLNAIEGKPAVHATGQDALASLQLIEGFYRRRSLAPMPWLNERETVTALAARTK
jgi:predicted dehydrogenase